MQKSTDWEIESLTSRIDTIEKKLYSGNIHNPKELQGFQQEQGDFKKMRSGLEDKALALMEQAEKLTVEITAGKEALSRLEAQTQMQHTQLNAELDKYRADHSELENRKQAALTQLDAVSLAIYRDLRKRKGVAVAKVEQGICKGCRIALPNSDLQQVRGGGLVKCSSCGRVLYLP